MVQRAGGEVKQLLAIIMAASISLGGCVCLGAGWVYEFDGVGAYVNIEMGLLTARPYTFSAWVKTTTSGGCVIFSGAAGSQDRYDSLFLFGSKAYAGSRYTSSGNAVGTSDVDDGAWHHLCAVFTSDSSRAIYVDGIVEDTDSTSITFQQPNRTRIGYFGDSTPSLPFDGQIRSTRIHNRALTAAEIRGLYKAGGGRNDFGSLSIVLPRADDQSLVFSLDRPVTAASTGDVLATDAVITSKDAARNYGLAKGGVTVGPAAIATPAP